MDRRDVLKLGALASVGGSGCASLMSNPAAVGAGALDGFLASLDLTLDRISTGKFFLEENRTLNPRHEELARKTLRSMLLVGTLQELPPEHLPHEGVQRRLRASMGDFDDAMFGMTELLEGLSPTERATVSTALRDDPQLGMRIMGSVDDEAAGLGISLKQRTKLRALSAQACARLRQSPDLAIAEYTGKVRKVVARHGAREAAERSVAASLGSELLWHGQADDGSSRGGVGGLTPPPPPPTSEPVQDTTPTPGIPGCASNDDCAPGVTCTGHRDLGDGKWSRGVCDPHPPKKRKSSPAILTAGGIVMGLALTTFGVGAATGSNGLLIGATLGAIIGVIGLVVLIIGLIVLAGGN